MTKEELKQEAEEYVMREDVITENDKVPFDNGYGFQTVSFEDEVKKGFQDGAEFGYNKAKEEMQAQEYSMSYENGIFKCKYKSGKRFESVDGKTWKEIVLPKEIE